MLTFLGGSMPSKHDTTRVASFYGTGRRDFYSLYVHIPHAVSHILHHAQVVRQIGCLSAVTTKSETMYFSPVMEADCSV